jgi:hypothetical protein
VMSQANVGSGRVRETELPSIPASHKTPMQRPTVRTARLLPSR